MKNVRLFAVAAALGMFASTVAAAEPTKTVTWSDVDSVIKVDLGEALVATAPTATVTIRDEKEQTGSIYAIQPSVNNTNGWLYTDTLFWTDATIGEAYNVLGLSGYRFLAPGSEEVDSKDEVFVNQSNGEVYKSVDEAFEGLVKAGFVNTKYNADEELEEVTLAYCEKPYYEGSKNTEYVTYLKVTPGSHKKAEANIKEAVVNFYANGSDIATIASIYTVSPVRVDTNKAAYKPSVLVTDGTVNVNLSYSDVADGVVVTVEENRKGFSVEAYNGNATSTLGATKTVNVMLTDATSVDETTVANLNKGDKFVEAADDEDIYTVSYYKEAGESDLSKLSDGTLLDASGETITSGAGAKVVVNHAAVTANVFVLKTTAYGTFKADKEHTYMTAGGEEFKNSDIVRLGAADAFAYSTNYDWVTYNGTDTTQLDAVAYVTESDNGTYVAHTADYVHNTITVVVGGNTVTVNESNADKYFNNKYLTTMVVDGYAIGTQPADFATDAAKFAGTAFAATSYVGLLQNRTTFDKLDYSYASGAPLVTNGYFRVNNGETNWTVDGSTENAYAVATGAYLTKSVTNGAYNNINKLGKAGYVTFVEVSDADAAKKYEGAYVVKRVAIEKGATYALKQDYKITVDKDITVEMVNHETAATITAGGNAGDDATLFEVDGANNYAYNSIATGLTQIDELPANDTQYYVLATGYNGFDISDAWSYSASKGTGTLTMADGKTVVDCKAVQLERKGSYLPAFETKEELEKAVLGLTGLDTALVGDTKTVKSSSTFYTWYTANVAEAKLRGVTLPTDAAIKENKTVDSTSTDVKVTSNKDEIDTSVAGVKELTYTASYKDEVVGTKTVTVVVAPKYTRTWENGRVKTLKSYYVTNPSQVYADYTYNWAAKTVTYTYYNVDGSVASQGTNNLD